jgi:hypothetical protein
MAQTVEISLRVPSLRATKGEHQTERIENAEVRFSKQIEVDRIPKAGDILDMTVSSGDTFKCIVMRSDWSEDKNLFVVACRYFNRSISPAEYAAFMSSSDWHVKGLL